MYPQSPQTGHHHASPILIVSTYHHTLNRLTLHFSLDAVTFVQAKRKYHNDKTNEVIPWPKIKLRIAGQTIVKDTLTPGKRISTVKTKMNI
jgi:hypothetical protein